MDKKIPPLVDWSCRLYARLLAILPGGFRQDYAQPILQAFGDLCLAAWQTHGPLGLASAWVQALPDLAKGAAGEWQFEITSGGTMERISVRTLLLMVLVICATVLALLVFPHEIRIIAGLLALMATLSVAVSGWRSRYWQQAAPLSPASDPAAAVSAEKRSSWVRYVLIGLEVVFLGLLVYVLRFLFSSQPTPGEAHRLIIDPNVVNESGRSLWAGVIISGVYLAVTVFGTHTQRPGARPWLVGTTAGGIAGLVAVLLALAVPLNNAWLLVMFVPALLAGVIAGRQAGQTEAGALGGFWCGLACALVWAVGGMILDLALAPQLAGTAWAVSHASCQGLVGTSLAACAAADDYRNWGLMLLGLPILSSDLGVIGGLLGAALAKARQPVQAGWGRALVIPAVFCGIMILVYVAGVIHLL
jgi:hypothetical protein